MNTKKGNNGVRGFGVYLMLILLVALMWFFLDGRSTTNAYTRAQFEQDLEAGKITAY